MSDTPPQSPPSAEPPEQNGAFARWRRKCALVTGFGVTEAERRQDLMMSHLRHCEKKKEYLLEYSQFYLLFAQIEGPNMFVCRSGRCVYAEASEAVGMRSIAEQDSLCSVRQDACRWI